MSFWFLVEIPYGMTIFMIVTMPQISVEGTVNAYFSCHQYTFSCRQLPSNHQGIGVCGVYLGAQEVPHMGKIVSSILKGLWIASKGSLHTILYSVLTF